MRLLSLILLFLIAYFAVLLGTLYFGLRQQQKGGR
jgi:predicted secreted protein